MKISIIIPVYNVEKYVIQCLQSVVDQIWNGNIECIVVDDCCTDSSMTLIEKFEESYSGSVNFKIIQHERNMGLSAARNTGMDAATGDYFYFLDGDDYMTKDCLLLMAEKVAEHPGVEMVHGTIKSDPYSYYYDKVGLKSVYYIDSNKSVKTLYFDLSINATDKLLAVDFIKKNQLRFKERLIHEDELWSYHLYDLLTSIAFVHKTTYVHFIREGSIMTTTNQSKDRRHWLAILKEIFFDIDDPCCSNIDKYYTAALVRYNDGSAKWKTLYENVLRKIRSNGHYLYACVLGYAFEHQDPYFSTWLKVYRNRSIIVQALAAFKHILGICF